MPRMVMKPQDGIIIDDTVVAVGSCCALAPQAHRIYALAMACSETGVECYQPHGVPLAWSPSKGAKHVAMHVAMHVALHVALHGVGTGSASGQLASRALRLETVPTARMSKALFQDSRS